MVGGAISGYCAIGSVESAITPTRVMTMLITPAKIGRSMKKCGKFIAVAFQLRSFCVLWLSNAWLSVWAGRCLLRHGRNFHPRLQQLQARGDNFLPVFESAFHDPFAFESARRLKGAAFDRIIRFHHEGIFQSLL